MTKSEQQLASFFSITDSEKLYDSSVGNKISCLEYKDITNDLNEVGVDNFNGFKQIVNDYADDHRVAVVVYFQYYKPNLDLVNAVKFYSTSSSRPLEQYLFDMHFWLKDLCRGYTICKVELAKCKDLDIEDTQVRAMSNQEVNFNFVPA